MAPPFPRSRHAMISDVCDRLRSGYTLAQAAALPGYPSRRTVYRWGLTDPDVFAELARAREGRRGQRWQVRLERGVFDAERAERFLVRVRLGDAVRKLVRQPPWPSRAVLNRWKHEQPAFAQALDAAVLYARATRSDRWRFNPAVADELMVRLLRGETLPQLMADPRMPGREILRRWRRRNRFFDLSMRSALLARHRRRMRGRCGCTPEIVDMVGDLILDGETLHSLSGRHGLPHHVTLYGWMRTRPDFARAVTAARQVRRDFRAEQTRLFGPHA